MIYDSARMEAEIINAKDLNNKFCSLFLGFKQEKSLSGVAPYIFQINTGDTIDEWYFEKGWGDSWGVILFSGENLKYLAKHFRNFLIVKTEEGEELYFRFYDPRVLRIFLPTCDQQQLKEFFGPVDYFICEDEDPMFGLVFDLDHGKLNTIRISSEQVISFKPEEKKKKFSFFG
jgi:hypothetical protein